MTAVRIQGDPKKGESADNMKKAHPDAIVDIDSMALFSRDKLVGFLSVEDTRDYLWTQNKIKSTTISIPCGKDQYASIRIIDSKTELKGSIKNGKPKIDVNMIMEGFISLVVLVKVHWTIQILIRKLINSTNQYVKEHVLKRSKRFKKIMEFDIFGFGEVVARQDYKNFKKVQDHWDEAFKDAEIEVSVVTKLRRAGIRTKGVFERMK